MPWACVPKVCSRASCWPMCRCRRRCTKSSWPTMPRCLSDVRRAAGADLLADAEALLQAAGAQWESEVVGGDPGNLLVELIENYGCDAVVMGCGAGSPGSVAAALLKHSPVPVTLVKVAADAQLDAALCRTVPRTRCQHLDGRQGGGAASLFRAASAADAAWAVYFLAGGKPRQTVSTKVLRALACEIAGVDDWLFEECYQAVGDLAETISLILPPAAARRRSRPGRLDRGLPAAAARAIARAAGRGDRRLLGRTRFDRPLPAQQADRRRIPGRRQQAAGAARAGRTCRARCQAGGAADDGLHRQAGAPGCRGLRAAGGCRRRIRPQATGGRQRPAVSVFPGPPARPAAGRFRRHGSARRRLADRMEIRRHPGPGGPPGRADLDLVARRGTDHRALSGGGRAGAGLARRHHRRRRDRDLEGRCAGAVCAAAAAHRPQDADPQDPDRRCRPASSPTTCWPTAAAICAAEQQQRRRSALETFAPSGAAPGCGCRRCCRAPTGTNWPRCASSRARAASRG